MAKSGVMAVDMTEILERLSGARREPPKQRTVDEVRKDTDEIVRAALHGCKDPDHHATHEALATFIKTMFRMELLSDKVREPFVRFLASDVLHHMDDEDSLGQNLKDLFSGRAFVTLVTMAYMVSALYERPDLTAAVPETKALSTGHYL
jgi:hypothetical protein